MIFRCDQTKPKNLITLSHFSIKQNLSSLQCKAVRFLSDIQQSCLPRPSRSTNTCNYRSWERTGQIWTDCTVDICAVLFLFRFQDFLHLVTAAYMKKWWMSLSIFSWIFCTRFESLSFIVPFNIGMLYKSQNHINVSTDTNRQKYKMDK